MKYFSITVKLSADGFGAASNSSKQQYLLSSASIFFNEVKTQK
jgi:hypothetical protein